MYRERVRDGEIRMIIRVKKLGTCLTDGSYICIIVSNVNDMLLKRE